MTNAEQDQWEEARSMVYGFFSQAFLQGPSRQFLETLMGDEEVANLRDVFPDAAYQQELAQVGLDAREGRLTLDGASLDFEALFRVPGTRYLSPYESVYRSQTDGGRGCLCGPEAVGVEMEFMAYLCRKTAEAMNTGDRSAVEKYHQQQHRFFTEHVGTWVGLLARRLASQAQTSLYRFLGNFLNLFLELEEKLHFQEAGAMTMCKAAGASRELGLEL
jgi:TorA maturation chaperone TorD